jgi:hypothetical protein
MQRASFQEWEVKCRRADPAAAGAKKCGADFGFLLLARIERTGHGALHFSASKTCKSLLSELRNTQNRLVYSLLKPAVSMAARFHVPMRTLSELLRLGYFEALRRQGLSQATIGDRLGQTARHMRTLASKLKGDFFTAEREVGLVREAENEVARTSPSLRALHQSLHAWPAEQVDGAVATLVAEGRVVREKGRLRIAPRYLVLSSDKFHHRIDALNHFLDGVTRAIEQRLLFEERDQAMVKTISFVARPAKLEELLRSLEANLRREIAQLEEDAQFEGEGKRYVLGVFAAKDEPEALPSSSAPTQ